MTAANGTVEKLCENPPDCRFRIACPTRIRVVLVDDHLVVLESLAARIDADASLEVVGTASTGEDGLRLILETKPDVAVFDVDLPGRGSFDIAAELASRQQETKIVFLTGFLSDVFIEQALRLGAYGYLMKSEPAGVLVESIQRAARGDVCFSKDVEDRVVYDTQRKRFVLRAESRLAALTGRQLEVLRHLAKGQSVKEVAKLMHLSAKSIESHKYRIMHKLGIHDRVELARYAIREGLTPP